MPKAVASEKLSESYKAEQDIFSQLVLILAPMYFYKITVNLNTFVF